MRSSSAEVALRASGSECGWAASHQSRSLTLGRNSAQAWGLKRTEAPVSSLAETASEDRSCPNAPLEAYEPILNEAVELANEPERLKKETEGKRASCEAGQAKKN